MSRPNCFAARLPLSWWDYGEVYKYVRRVAEVLVFDWRSRVKRDAVGSVDVEWGIEYEERRKK